MLNTIAVTLVPVAFVIFLGYRAARLKFFGGADRAMLTRLVLTWLLPPLLLAGILQTPRSDLMDYRIPLLFVVGLTVPYLAILLGSLFVLRYDLRTSTLRASLLAFPDMVFMGVPVLGQLFGPSSLYPILIANLVPSLIIVPLTTVLLEIGSNSGKSAGARRFFITLVKAIREPRVWVPFIGIVLMLLDLHIPAFAIDSLKLIGNSTTGISLFLAGLIIAEEKVELTKAVAIDCLVKNLVHPVAMFAAVLALGITGVVAREAILLAALPSAVITTMFAEEHHVLESESSTTILATRVLAFATIPLMIVATQHLMIS
ncbi:AEC family transporter [Mesorhizobium sp. Cs1299R1N1]|uniref:AEC family transporter n=1 Tax=Mesorhizobium sp. Cs1299R1N1 TaxID=3015172 RepID=UPI00301D155B